MIRRVLLLTVLLAANVTAAMGVVSSKHHSRELQSRLQSLRVERDRLKTEQAQLQLEESTWANPDRVTRIARQRLQMHQPRDYTVLRGGQ